MREENPANGKVLLVVSMIAALLSLGSLIVAVKQSVEANATAATLARNNCTDIEKVKSFIEASVNRSLKTIPTLSYYKDHPDELAKARVDLLLEQKQFSKTRC